MGEDLYFYFRKVLKAEEYDDITDLYNFKCKVFNEILRIKSILNQLRVLLEKYNIEKKLNNDLIYDIRCFFDNNNNYYIKLNKYSCVINDLLFDYIRSLFYLYLYYNRYFNIVRNKTKVVKTFNKNLEDLHYVFFENNEYENNESLFLYLLSRELTLNGFKENNYKLSINKNKFIYTVFEYYYYRLLLIINNIQFCDNNNKINFIINNLKYKLKCKRYVN